MAKTSLKHFSVDPWKVTETEYKKDFSMVAESVFSLGNEYMGVRGFLEEGTAFPTLNGTYFNGIYEYSDRSECAYKGISTRTHYMVNAVNFTDVKLSVNGKPVDMSQTPYNGYERTLYLNTGKLVRKLTFMVDGVNLAVTFTRFLDMQRYKRFYQRITFTADRDCTLTLSAYLRFDGKHFGKESRWTVAGCEKDFIMAKTQSTDQYLACAADCEFNVEAETEYFTEDKICGKSFTVGLKKDREAVFTRLVSVSTENDAKQDAFSELELQKKEGYDKASARNDLYWQDFWSKSDIEIDGDEDNQQGIRFCIFQLQQTYHGAKEGDNIGAKGLTGEAYSGNAFWDTESYCLPYYLFNNLAAAKSLLEFRYKTLDMAKERAKDLDLSGACYPIATISGEEACTLWQHASLQMQPSTAVAYGIYHYYNVSGDTDYLYSHGGEMLIEICRYLLSRGQWDNKNRYFGYYCVMGPDEFQMMVNHNTYTNFMAKKAFLFTIEVLDNMPKDKLKALSEKTGFKPEERDNWLTAAQNMLILYDEKTMLYEQHDGFFDLPHIDVDSISDKDFPLYSHWSYDRIYRNDMIKQPDVLMFQLLYSGDFSRECKKANYEYYEPLCIHESSLSPSVHSIIATEIGKYDEALEFFKFATRLDLDDYNRNTKEGLHTTSISAAWLNIVYGFAGLRSDKEISLSPMLPKPWKGYSFRLTIKDCNIKITVNKESVVIENLSKTPLTLNLYGKKVTINDILTVDSKVAK